MPEPLCFGPTMCDDVVCVCVSGDEAFVCYFGYSQAYFCRLYACISFSMVGVGLELAIKKHKQHSNPIQIITFDLLCFSHVVRLPFTLSKSFVDGFLPALDLQLRFVVHISILTKNSKDSFDCCFDTFALNFNFSLKT